MDACDSLTMHQNETHTNIYFYVKLIQILEDR